MATRTLTGTLFTALGIALLDVGPLAASMQRGDEAALLEAARDGRVESVVQLLGFGTDPNVQDEHGVTPLMFAALNGDSAMIAALLEAGADPDARDEDLDTPLGYYASGSGNLAVATMLLEHGADLSAANANGVTPLMFASEAGFTDMVRDLLESGADPNARDKDGDTALGFYAVGHGRLDVLRLLVQSGADVNAKANDGWTPLHYGVAAGDFAVVTELLDRGADPNATQEDGVTALMGACEFGHSEIAVALLDAGADATIVDDDNATALMYAAANENWEIADVLVAGAGLSMEQTLVLAAADGYADVVTALLERGVDADSRDSDSTTALIAAAVSGFPEIIELLLDNGADLEARDAQGFTALGYAAQSDFADIVRLLLDRDASMHAGPSGSSALMVASVSGAEEVTLMLLDEGADMEATADDGATAMLWAALYGRTANVRALLERGANVDARNTLGVSALTWSAMNGHTEVAELLIEHGAEVDSRDSGNDTPLHYATMNGHLAVVELLLEHGADPLAKNYGGITPIDRARDKGNDAVLGALSGAASVADLAAAQSDIDAILISLDDLPTDVEMTAAGAAGASEFIALVSTPLHSLQRQFAPQNMVFTYGSSSLAVLQVAAGEFPTAEQAQKQVLMLQLFDLRLLFESLVSQFGGGQMTLGDFRQLDTGGVGDVAQGWLMEMSVAFATLDMALVVFTRGRVTASLMAGGVSGSVMAEDIQSLIRTMDERIGLNPDLVTDLDSLVAAALDSVSSTGGPTVAERADGIALDQIVPGAADIPGSMVSSSRYYERQGYRAYERELGGRGFKVALGQSQVVSVCAFAKLFDSDVEAVKEVLQSASELSEGEESYFAEMIAMATEREYRDFEAPQLGTATLAVEGSTHGAVNVDLAMVAFSVGRLAAGVVAIGPVGSLRSEDLIPLAIQEHGRLVELAPAMASRGVAPDVRAAVEEIVRTEAAAVELAKAGGIDEALSAVAQADTVDATVGIDGRTWDALCRYGSLTGRAADVLGACDAAVTRDSTLVNWRENRAVARALIGDHEGAIDDLLYVSSHLEDSDLIKERQQWIQVLRRGRNPITEEVLERLRQRAKMK